MAPSLCCPLHLRLPLQSPLALLLRSLRLLLLLVVFCAFVFTVAVAVMFQVC